MEKVITPLLSGIIDYAGLFPPAKLSLKQAIDEYLYYRHSDYDWMVSQFIISTQHLDQLAKLADEGYQLPDPFHLSITAPPSATVDDYFKQLDEILHQVENIHRKLSVTLQTDMLEIKLPDEVLSQPSDDAIMNVLERTCTSMDLQKKYPNRVFFEIPGFDFNSSNAQRVIEALAKYNNQLRQENPEYYRYCGFKIRCGGMESHHFPSATYLADAILQANKKGVTLKFTAGLHHPVRIFHPSVQTKMFGFLNIFGAGIFSRLYGLTKDEIMAILEEENPKNFNFTKDYFSWNAYKATPSQIKQLRHDAFISFGSCSVAEPVEDLQELGIIK